MNLNLRLLSAALLLALAVGCGSSIPFAPVQGQVTLGGTPLAGVVVRFMPDSVKGTPGPTSEGVTDGEGRFVLRCLKPPREGAVVGWHRVVVEDPEEERPMQGQPRRRKPRLPAAYANIATSNLSAEVRPDKPKVDLTLTWR